MEVRNWPSFTWVIGRSPLLPWPQMLRPRPKRNSRVLRVCRVRCAVPEA